MDFILRILEKWLYEHFIPATPFGILNYWNVME
jgi:hypothetical protein